jgi:uncharacterized protein
VGSHQAERRPGADGARRGRCGRAPIRRSARVGSVDGCSQARPTRQPHRQHGRAHPGDARGCDATAGVAAASAIGWYGDTGSAPVDETAPNGTGFLATLVRDWEQATIPAQVAGIRVVNLRSGVVLSGRGGMLKPLLLPFRLGLGARIGAGTQYVSWITLADHVAATRFLLSRDDLAGPVNLTAPVPATNAELTAALATALHRPALVRLPAGAVRLALGELSTELLSSSRVVPARLEAAGFTFQHPTIQPAVAAAITDS